MGAYHPDLRSSTPLAPRRHKTPKRIRNLGIKAPHESIHKIQEELKSKLKTFGHRVLQIFSIRAVGNLFTSLGPALGLYPMKMDTLSLTALTSLWKVKVRSCRAETLRKQMSEKTRWIRVVIQVFRRSSMWFTQKVSSNSKLARLSVIKVFFFCCGDAMRQLEHVISRFQAQFPLTTKYSCTLCSHILGNW